MFLLQQDLMRATARHDASGQPTDRMELHRRTVRQQRTEARRARWRAVVGALRARFRANRNRQGLRVPAE